MLPVKLIRPSCMSCSWSSLDGQAAGLVEELQGVRVDGELERLPVPDPAFLGDPGRPQGLAACQSRRGLILVCGRLGRLGEAGVLHVRRVDSRLMAHACVLLGDLGHGQTARQYGTAALLLAQEAEADEAIAWSVQAKTARWTGGFVEAAEFARRGFEVSGSTPTRVELAWTRCSPRQDSSSTVRRPPPSPSAM